jgi:hypothetical protein
MPAAEPCDATLSRPLAIGVPPFLLPFASAHAAPDWSFWCLPAGI